MKKEYRLETFPSLWKDMVGLVTQKRLFAPNQVLEELKHKDDDICQWCRSRKDMFVREDIRILTTAQSIIRNFPQLSDHDKEIEDADPYVVALAQELKKQKTLNNRNVKVVANEGEKKFHIHDVCGRMGIDSIRFVEMVYLEGWKY
jgi:hypothetical protein